MRAILIGGMMLAASGCTAPGARFGGPAGPGGPPPAQAAPGGPGEHPGGPGPGARLFLSPMGEPFRGGPGLPPPPLAWFDGADTNKDQALTLAEFQADATRFFKLLDVDGDGEIGPEEIERYETRLAPEIRVRDGGDPAGARGGPPGGEARRPAARERQGAARFSWFDLPQPVTAADGNLNRGIDPREFAKAAEVRFAALDRNGDGRITRDELPRLPAPGPERGGRPGGHRAPPGGGMGGGFPGA